LPRNFRPRCLCPSYDWKNSWRWCADDLRADPDNNVPQYTAPLAQGPTIAHFDAATIGPKPWMVQIKIAGTPSTTITVGK
jgi:hypothetical protein